MREPNAGALLIETVAQCSIGPALIVGEPTNWEVSESALAYTNKDTKLLISHSRIRALQQSCKLPEGFWRRLLSFWGSPLSASMIHEPRKDQAQTWSLLCQRKKRVPPTPTSVPCDTKNRKQPFAQPKSLLQKVLGVAGMPCLTGLS